MIWKYLSDMVKILPTGSNVAQFRNVVFKINDKVSKNVQFQNIHSNTLYGAMFYLAKEHLKISIKLKDISLSFNTNDSSILACSKNIRNYLACQ